MKIKIQDHNDVTIVELMGDLDSESSVQLKNTISDLISKNRIGIILEMTNIAFIDSEGLERLLWARDYCNENTCQLRLAGLDENCSEIMKVTRLDREFDRYTELAEAVKSFA